MWAKDSLLQLCTSVITRHDSSVLSSTVCLPSKIRTRPQDDWWLRAHMWVFGGVLMHGTGGVKLLSRVQAWGSAEPHVCVGTWS